MKLFIVAVRPDAPAQAQSTFIVDDVLAIDAGCLLQLPLDAQRRVRHVLLSHAHMDHIGTLPMFLDNVYELGPDCPSVYASGYSIDVLQRHILNDRVWPDFVRLGGRESPFVRFVPLEPEQPVLVEGIQVTAVELSHTIPTYGFVLERNGRRLAVVSDTGPTERIWYLLRQSPPDLLLLDLSFPNSMEELANRSGHLCPRSFADELAKLGRAVRTLAIHIKPAFYEAVAQEVLALGLPHVSIARLGQTYDV